MLLVSNEFREAMIAPVRRFRAKVGVTKSGGDYVTYTDEDALKTIEIQRVGDDSKFFGYTISQRINVKLVDLNDEITLISNSPIEAEIGVDVADGVTEYIGFPTFYLTEKNRSEEDGGISLTGYDKLDFANLHTVSGLLLTPPYSIYDFVVACADILNLGIVLENIPEDDYAFNLVYSEGANFEGTENLRDALNQACEATQTIAYVDSDDCLHFKRLDIGGLPVATITPDDYFTLSHGDNRRLVKVSHVTELGDNVGSTRELTGTTQYVRNNPFWDLRDDIAEIVENAIGNVYGLTINQFDCQWRGFPLLEIGDKIDLQKVCVDGCVESAYVLDDVISYDGAYQQVTQWHYNNTDAETEDNPTNIGDALNQTFAKVDKINKEIALVASSVSENAENISQIKLTTNDISLSVSDMQKTLSEGLESVDGEIETLTKKVEAGITAEDVQIKINSALENGVTKVETTTGYLFDDEGLTISKSGSEISTQITENGMTVSRNEDVVLTANNRGVNATNLHATTYLIIGNNSRFEDFININGEARTGCFWIG